MNTPKLELSLATIQACLNQIQGVEHVLAHQTGKTFTVLAWVGDQCFETAISTVAELGELADIVDCHVTDSLTSKKRSLNYRITY